MISVGDCCGVFTPSIMAALSTKKPAFLLPDLSGEWVSSADFADATATLVAFICPHCASVQRIRSAFSSLAGSYMKKGVAVVGINSNDVDNHPEDGPQAMADEATAAGYPFPYLFDPFQEAARAFQAACTPDFIFLIDPSGWFIEGVLMRAVPAMASRSPELISELL